MHNQRQRTIGNNSLTYCWCLPEAIQSQKLFLQQAAHPNSQILSIMLIVPHQLCVPIFTFRNYSLLLQYVANIPQIICFTFRPCTCTSYIYIVYQFILHTNCKVKEKVCKNYINQIWSYQYLCHHSCVIRITLYMCYIARAYLNINKMTMGHVRMDGSGTMDSTTRYPFEALHVWQADVYIEVATTCNRQCEVWRSPVTFIHI